ncbi:hypothetical protein ACFE04_017608 [Oxalis oulophora]
MTGLRVHTITNGSSSSVVNGDSKLPVMMIPNQSQSQTSPFFGSRNMMSFQDIHTTNNNSFLRPYDFDHQDYLDDYFHQPGQKKRRLTDDQAKFLEKTFDHENKLDPERKLQLAKELGLQPRQIAIWFQNRRARWKTKRMEKDYDTLQASYHNLKADCESLVKVNDNLKAQALLLKDKLQMKGNPELSSDIISTRTPLEGTPRKAIADDSASLCILSKESGVVSCKQEESPHYADVVHSSVYVFEHDQSEEEDNLSKSLLHSCTFPKVEDVDYSDPPTSSCNFGFAVEDQAFWSWSYN